LGSVIRIASGWSSRRGTSFSSDIVKTPSIWRLRAVLGYATDRDTSGSLPRPEWTDDEKDWAHYRKGSVLQWSFALHGRAGSSRSPSPERSRHNPMHTRTPYCACWYARSVRCLESAERRFQSDSQRSSDHTCPALSFST